MDRFVKSLLIGIAIGLSAFVTCSVLESSGAIPRTSSVDVNFTGFDVQSTALATGLAKYIEQDGAKVWLGSNNDAPVQVKLVEQKVSVNGTDIVIKTGDDVERFRALIGEAIKKARGEKD